MEDRPLTYARHDRKDLYYSRRLFSGGLRSWVHLARFRWLRANLVALDCRCESVVELGCHDGMAIDFMPLSPRRYLGFDADQADGLTLAAKRWRERPEFRFRFSKIPQQMDLTGESFDTAIALETLEHIPPEHLDGYLARIAAHLDGHFFVSVPNEKGIVFLTKWIAKKALLGRAQHYSLAELVNATIGRMHLVERSDHKGFDYIALARQLGHHFEVLEVSGIPFRWLPAALNPYVGIVARTKH